MIPSVTGGRAVGLLSDDIDFNFTECEYVIDNALTVSGGANGVRMNSAGVVVPVSAPRIEFNPVGLAVRGLLSEIATTNLALQSGDATASPWTVSSGTRTSTSALLSPSGSNSVLIVPTNGVANGRVQQNITPAVTGVHTISVWAAASGITSFQLLVPGTWYADATNRIGTFNLGTGAVTSATSGSTGMITAYAGGWYRCALTVPAIDTLAAGSLLFRTNTTGDGTSGFYVWGAQMEAGSCATSYVPTTAATVTRSADNVSYATTSIQGTWVVEFATNQNLLSGSIFWGVATDSSNNAYLTNASGNLVLLVNNGGVQQVSLSLGALAVNTTYKVAFSIFTNEVAARVNGGAEQLDTSVTLPSVTTMSVGHAPWGSFNQACAFIRRIRHSARNRRGELLPLST